MQRHHYRPRARRRRVVHLRRALALVARLLPRASPRRFVGVEERVVDRVGRVGEGGRPAARDGAQHRDPTAATTTVVLVVARGVGVSVGVGPLVGEHVLDAAGRRLGGVVPVAERREERRVERSRVALLRGRARGGVLVVDAIGRSPLRCPVPPPIDPHWSMVVALLGIPFGGGGGATLGVGDVGDGAFGSHGLLAGLSQRERDADMRESDGVG